MSPFPPPAPRILVVDDAAVVRLYHRHLLQQLGCVVEEAVNGIEGLEKAFSSRFDACIVDVNMPLMDGLAFLTQLRSNPATRGLPALVITTQDGKSDRHAALQAGANFFLVKPAEEETFIASIHRLLGRTVQTSAAS